MPGVPVLGPLMARLFGTRNERFVRRYLHRVEMINALETEMAKLTDAQLRAKTAEFRSRYQKAGDEQEMLVEAFAVAREVMDRAVGIRNIFDPNQHFDPAVLNERARKLYADVKASMVESPDLPPTGDLIGNIEPVPAWKVMPIPNEIYAAVRQAYPQSKPPFRAHPFDVQLVGGMVLAEHRFDRIRSAARARDVYFGNIAEMKTGEGKTIVAPLACYLHALAMRQIHVVTVNTYLVRRDRYWTFPFFHHLGLTVGYIAPYHEMPEQFKKTAYQCDIVYGTTSEFGFDYLRDNMKLRVEDQVQRERIFAIVDEVDSTLIDEARTPLIISGPAHEDSPRYHLADKLAAHLVEKQKPWQEADKKFGDCRNRIKGLEGDIRNARDKSTVPEMKAQIDHLKKELPRLEQARDLHRKYYEVELDKKSVHVEHNGVTEAQHIADIGSFYVGDNIDMPHLLEQALRARAVYERDKDYVVKDGAIVIVDQFTGRLMIGRQWSDGLHQAIEAKERVEIKPETQTMATITIQNFFKLYERLAGMTGTADTEAQEFHDIYNMDVVVIPTNVPVVRNDYNDRIYLTGKDKWGAIVEEIKVFHDLGRPVLVGTTSVEKSEMLSQRLTKKYNIQHEVLNAKQHEREAHMIESAGGLGAVMIATNMAGRGTDIKLQPIERQALLDHWKRRQICPRQVEASMSDEEIISRIHRFLAERSLGLKKPEIEAMSDADIIHRLLVFWATEHSMYDEKRIGKMNDDELRAALDENGNFLLHRLAVWKTTEGLGGLHVIGTERHESRRIDNQLRGRSGRQGDHGSSRFFISLEDDLMKMFAGDTTQRVLSRLGMKEGDAIEAPMLTRAVERAQRKVEERNFEIRKNILEYDEVMDHQRHDFYSRRQRVLEGRRLREFVLELLGEAIDDACDRFLSPDYVPICVADWVQNTLDISMPPDRLMNIDREDMIARINRTALEDARNLIGVSIGEFKSDEGDTEDWDLKGLVNWAKDRYGVDLSMDEVRDLPQRQIVDRLSEAARAQIEAADFTEIEKYLEPNYARKMLVAWAHDRFGIEVKPEDFADLSIGAASNLLFRKVEEAYAVRELRYPVDYAVDMTMAIMAQDPRAALSNLSAFAKFRFGLNLDERRLLAMTPREYHKEMLDANEDWMKEGRPRAIEAALRDFPDDESLNAHLHDRYRMPLREKERGLQGDARREMIEAKFETFSRGELMQFERYVLLQVLDGSWKDHLYSMDQLRNAIGFRSFAQQDPRVEYRREGRRNYDQMTQGIREKVADVILKGKLMPQVNAPGRAPGPAPR